MIQNRRLGDEDGHWEWAPEADLKTPGVKRIIYRPRFKQLKATSALVRVVAKGGKK